MIFIHRFDVERIAPKHRLPVSLVIAVCLVESGGNRWAWNAEPRYRYLWDVQQKKPFRRLTADEQASEVPPADFHALAGDRDQEWWGQAASWGLMQVMGAVAREYGFQEPYLPQLCDASYGIEFGCSVLASRMHWAQGNIARALAAYNAGPGNADEPIAQHYAAKVLAKQDEIKAAL